MPEYAALAAAWGLGAPAVAYLVFKWLFPFFAKVMNNAVARAGAEGDIVVTLTAERDKYYADARSAYAALQEMNLKYAKMTGAMQLMRYQLYEARVKIATLTGETPPPMPPDETA